MGAYDEAERLEAATLEGWSDWLAEHPADARGVWLVMPRRAADRRAFGYEEAVCEALRYGWIDAVVRPLDEDRTMQWFAPRRPGSGWARPNKERVARLEEQGRMEAAGRAVVEAAKASGAWTMLDDVEDLVVPQDLAAALAERPVARERWEEFPASARKQMLYWIVTAKRPETRTRRVREVADKAARGIRARG